MSEHIREDRLHDYVDDLLCREERAEVERHLLACPDCQREVARLRDLLAGLARMPARARPSAELLPGIHAGMDAAERRARRARHAGIAAAAVLLVVAGTIGVRLAAVDGDARGPALATEDAAQADRTGGAAALPGGVQAVQRVEAAYVQSALELERLLAHERESLSPQTVRIVEENLAVIDRALAEARAALRDDPGNPVLEQILMANHQKKLDLLRGAARAGT